MIAGSSHATAASSSHRKFRSAYFATYCAAGVALFRTSSINSFSMRVFTEISTVVKTTRGQWACSTACEASGSIQKLNSCVGESANSGSSVCGLMLPAIRINSLLNSANCGSRAIAIARSVIGPAA